MQQLTKEYEVVDHLSSAVHDPILDLLRQGVLADGEVCRKRYCVSQLDDHCCICPHNGRTAQRMPSSAELPSLWDKKDLCGLSTWLAGDQGLTCDAVQLTTVTPFLEQIPNHDTRIEWPMFTVDAGDFATEEVEAR